MCASHFLDTADDTPSQMDFPSKVLDGMINIEERMTGGFSFYNKGQQLRTSLISADKVKSYLKKSTSDKV